MDPLTVALLVALGLFVGTLVGLTSVGSGALMTPILLLDFSAVLPKLLVVGTATTWGTLTKFVGNLQAYLKKAMRAKYAFFIAVTGVPLASLGAFYSAALITWNLFSPILAVILIAVAVVVMIQSKLEKKTYIYDFNFSRMPELTTGMRAKGMLIGVAIGLVAGLTGVSTGSLLVSSLILLLKFPQHDAVNIAIFEGSLILLAATATQLYLGHVSMLVTMFLLAGGVPGILIGGHFKYKINQKVLGYSIAAVIIFEALRTLSSFFFGASLIPFMPLVKKL